MAAWLDKYEEWSQLGEVICTDTDTVTLAWYDGTYSSAWAAVKIKEGSEYIHWRETVPRRAIILCDIKLTNGKKLRKDTVEKQIFPTRIKLHSLASFLSNRLL